MQNHVKHKVEHSIMNNDQVTGLFVHGCSQNHGKEMKIVKNKIN